MSAYSEPPHRPIRRPSDKRPRPTSQVFEVDGSLVTAFYGLVVVVSGISLAVFADGDRSRLALAALFVLVGLWGALLYGLWAPHRVTLDDDGILMQAPVRRVRIPWGELQSVAPPVWDVRNQTLRWRRARGHGVMTLSRFADLHRMLSEIEERAPHVYVSAN